MTATQMLLTVAMSAATADLDSTFAAARRRARSRATVTLYRVTIVPRNPAWNDKGEQFEIHAANKREAIARARRLVSYSRIDGALICRADKAE